MGQQRVFTLLPLQPRELDEMGEEPVGHLPPQAVLVHVPDSVLMASISCSRLFRLRAHGDVVRVLAGSRGRMWSCGEAGGGGAQSVAWRAQCGQPRVLIVPRTAACAPVTLEVVVCHHIHQDGPFGLATGAPFCGSLPPRLLGRP